MQIRISIEINCKLASVALNRIMDICSEEGDDNLEKVCTNMCIKRYFLQDNDVKFRYDVANTCSLRPRLHQRGPTPSNRQALIPTPLNFGLLYHSCIS